MTYPDAMKRDVVRALRKAPWSVRAVASAWRISSSTVLKWAREAGVQLPPAIERQRKGGRDAAPRGLSARWGDWQQRRAKAAKLRQQGKSLKQIAQKLGYRHESGAHYALR